MRCRRTGLNAGTDWAFIQSFAARVERAAPAKKDDGNGAFVLDRADAPSYIATRDDADGSVVVFSREAVRVDTDAASTGQEGRRMA